MPGQDHSGVGVGRDRCGRVGPARRGSGRQARASVPVMRQREPHDPGRSCLHSTIRRYPTNQTDSQNAGALCLSLTVACRDRTRFRTPELRRNQPRVRCSTRRDSGDCSGPRCRGVLDARFLPPTPDLGVGTHGPHLGWLRPVRWSGPRALASWRAAGMCRGPWTPRQAAGDHARQKLGPLAGRCDQPTAVDGHVGRTTRSRASRARRGMGGRWRRR
jgi:hypothetical protein